MDALLEELLEAPDLPQKLVVLNEAMARERTRRETFYAEMTPSQKVEFINGEVVLHSPARLQHTKALGFIYRLLSVYVDQRQLGYVGVEKVLVALTRNDYGPDVVFFGSEKAAQFAEEQMKFPAPDLAVEILSPSTERRDRGIKKRDYAAHGVAEYWIVDPINQIIEQYGLEDGSYRLRGAWRDPEQVSSTVVAGFRLPIGAAFDAESNLRTLESFSREPPPLAAKSWSLRP